MWIEANPNPVNNLTDDCVIRAISIILDADWLWVFDRLCDIARASYDGVVLPESIAIITPAAVATYQHVYNEVEVVVPCGCCANVGVRYVDGTPDDPATTGTPAITVRREATLSVTRTA